MSRWKPVIEIWIRPTRTIQQVLHSTTITQLAILILFSGLSHSLIGGYVFGERFPDANILLYVLLASPVVGVVSWILWSTIIFLCAKLLKGEGTWEETGVAIAWAQIPYIAEIILEVPYLIVDGNRVFTEESAIYLVPPMYNDLYVVLSWVISIWAIFTISKSIAVAHRISAWGGFIVVYLLPIFALVLPFVLVAMIFLSLGFLQ
ncbi:YIP1 family protein [Mechercharimyces sp. CAU 1602]|uniref:YIP1 family protein n=1 Tax=Mechercharimyces sp. CAU 1602 TaxID=2973933 RepID=UPI002161107F|nr:YIP1 family protein [Mechercharimyces sp. CAU 1602]MCS1352461.1 YIP1 family protein [Mechercharimyces sp. CAU 1602]